MADPADVRVRSWRSIRQWPTWAKWVGGAVALWWVAGWTLPKFGRVIDESTGKPVQGAYVVHVWNAFGMTMGGGRASCIALRVARTNAAGEYFISPAWAGVSIRRDPLIQAMRNGVMVYSPGMSLSRGDPGWTETIYLKAADPDREKRLEELYRYFYLNGCGSESELKRKVLGLYKDLYEEAVRVAPEFQREEAEASFRMNVEKLEIGWEKAMDRRSRRDRTSYK